MSSVGTVWDYEPDLPVKPLDPVSGKTEGLRGLNLAVFGELAVSLGALVKKIDEQQKRQRKANALPGDYPLSGAGVYPSSGNLLIALGSPDQGMFWQVRRLVIGGSDITTNPAGTGWVFVTGSPPNQAGANAPITQVSDFTSGTFPQKAFYGTHELIVNESEWLYVVITGGTAGTQYAVGGSAETYQMSDRAGITFEA